MSNPYNHRISSSVVTLTGSDGLPLRNREVKVSQTNHEFLFGTAEFPIIPYVNGEIEGKELELAEERFARIFEIFNFMTLPFYWARYEKELGKPDNIRTIKTAKWLKAKGIALKGHPLSWHTLCAPWLLDMTNDEIVAAQQERIYRDVAEMRGLIDMWDVINEVVIMPVFDKYDNGMTRVCSERGRISTVRTVFEAARKTNPEATLLINDFNTTWAYDILLDGLLEAGISIDAIGIQSHMHQGYWGVEKTQEILHRFSRFGLPLHFTENTIVSGYIMPPEIDDLNDFKHNGWPSTPEGEERQAQEIETHYRTLFADPNVVSITWWDTADGYWLDAPSGLLRRDTTAKPSFYVLRKLIKEEWWTPAKTLLTNENGEITVEGYRGTYCLESGGASAEIKLCKGQDKLALSL